VPSYIKDIQLEMCANQEGKYTYWAHDICDMTDTGSTGSSEIENLHARSDKNVFEATEHTSGELRPEGIPDTILDFRAFDGSINRYPLLTVDGFSRSKGFGNKQMLFSFGDEHTSVRVRLDDGLRCTTPGSTTTAARSASASTGCAASAASSSSITTCEMKLDNF
jgi:hypothetical protein